MTPEEVADKLVQDPEFLAYSEDERFDIFQQIMGQQDPVATVNNQQDFATRPASIGPIQGVIPETLKNVFARPAAATREAIRALPPGGETPFQAYSRGATIPETSPPFQDTFAQSAQQNLIDRGRGGPLSEAAEFVASPPAAILRSIGRSQSPGQISPLELTAESMFPAMAGMTADTLTNPAEMILGLLPGAPGINRIPQTKFGKAIDGILNKELHFKRLRNRDLGTKDILAVPEAKLNELSGPQKTAYFKQRARMLKNDFKAADDALKARQAELGKQLQDASVERVNELRPQISELQKKKSIQFQEITDAELAPIANEPVEMRELALYLNERYPNDPKKLAEVSGRLGVTNEDLIPPTSQIAETNAFGEPIVPGQRTRKVGELYNDAIDIGQEIPRSVRNSATPYSRSDYFAEESVGAMLDFLATRKNLDMSLSREMWRKWAPVRNQLVKEFNPGLISETKTGTGGRRLSLLARGADPHNKIYAETAAKELGIPDLQGPEMNKIVGAMDTAQKERFALQVQKDAKSGRLQELQSLVAQTTDRQRRKQRALQGLLKMLFYSGALGYGSYRGSQFFGGGFE